MVPFFSPLYKDRDDSGGRFSNRTEAWNMGDVVGVFMFPEHGCQHRSKRVPAPKNCFFCEDSFSSILSAVPWLWCSPRFLLNYLALFIIQRLSWRQALGSQKENCFYTFKWKKAGRPKCKPLRFGGHEI